MKEVQRILHDIQNKHIKPLYLLTGEEPFYIDYVSSFIEKNVLAEEEKSFNQLILYGRDVTAEDIINHAKRYPMMAERQVIIVKEAQELAREIDHLEPYVAQPTPTTVLVLCYKYKSFDKRKKLYKSIKSVGEVLETKTLYENQIASWIETILRDHNYKIEPKASLMLVEFLGNDLSRIYKELEKLMQIVPPSESITPDIIEKNIGISKDYNNFELQDALAAKEVKKVFRIVNYFANNPKDNPIVMTTALLFSFFQKVLKYHAMPDKSKAPSQLGVSPYFMKQYQTAARHYPPKKLTAIIDKLREIDLKSKGLGATQIPQGELLKELMYEILE
jgi:DNA polymerase-3 subunit delta